MKKKVLLTSIATIALCLCLIAGSTFALFTSESKVDISIKAAKVEMTASISDFKLESVQADPNGTIVDEFGGKYSYVERKDTFANGGTAVVTGSVVTLDKVTPGDKVSFNVEGANTSDVTIQYRYIIECIEGLDALAEGLVVSINGVEYNCLKSYTSTWMTLQPGQDITKIPVSIELPVKAGNEYQSKSAKLRVAIEAVQGNAATTNTSEIDLAVSTAEMLAKALKSDVKNIAVTLANDIEVPVSALSAYGQTSGSGEYKLGGDSTETISIDLNGHKLTLTTGYMTSIGAKNDNAIITIKNGSMNGTGNKATTWNINDLTFANCNYVFENVVFDKEVALTNTGKSTTMKNVTINGTGDYYALWISARGQEVEIDGLTVNTPGRGIKIDDQYVDAPAKVTLSVSNSKFDTAKKAAIMVKTSAGADITLNNVDIANTPDPVHAVWVDEDSDAYSDLVNVTPADSKYKESDVVSSATGLADAIANGDELIVVGAGTYTFPSGIKAGTTLVCGEDTVFEGLSKLNINGATVIGATFSNPTGTAADQTINGVFKNCTFTGKNGLRWAYAGDTVVFEDCVFDGSVYGVHFDGGANDVLFDGCTFSGFNAMGGAVTKLVMKDCTFQATGRSGYNGINLWGSTEMIDCTFVFDGTTSYEWVDACGDNKTYVFTNCVVTDGENEKGIGSVVGNYGEGNTIIINDKLVATNAAHLQEILDNATDGLVVYFANDIEGDVTATLKPGVKVTIDGEGHIFAGVITVDGKSATYTTAGLTIQNVVFKADSISADACVRLGDGTNNTRYTCNVTVSGCTFDVPGAVGVKSYTGGDKNVVITGCTATENAHSLAQLKGVDGVLVEGCKVYSKNGINFNNSDNVTIIGCEVDVKGYAVRFGESKGGVGAAETYKIENCTLKSANDDGDATVILRGTADYSTLTIVNTTIEGTPDIANTATGATVAK